MCNRHRHIANEHHEDHLSSRSFRGRRGVPAGIRRAARARNRVAKREDARWHVVSQDRE
jgi:hypothetical protein